MSTHAARRVLVVAGLGNGSGTGAGAARAFFKAGYSIALIARGPDTINQIAEEVNSSGGEAVPFTIASYGAADIASTWTAIRSRFSSPKYTIHAAIFNAGEAVWKSFLDVTPEDIERSLNINVAAAFAFAREAILTFQKNEIDQQTGKRGALIFTGATASLRGNVNTSAFAAGKFGSRALSQSLAKEFGKQNIHVAHAIIDGGIAEKRQLDRHPEWVDDVNARLSPASIASAYLYLVNQDNSAWTWELDLRPAHEKW